MQKNENADIFSYFAATWLGEKTPSGTQTGSRVCLRLVPAVENVDQRHQKNQYRIKVDIVPWKEV